MDGTRHLAEAPQPDLWSAPPARRAKGPRPHFHGHRERLRARAGRELAALPAEIRGYGFIKDAAAEKAQLRRAELLAAFEAGGVPREPAQAIAAE